MIFQAAANNDRHPKSTKHKVGKRVQELETNYSKCLSVLLSKYMRRSSNSDQLMECEDYSKQIRLIINKRDSMHNTPLHYAALNWPQTICRKLLNNGANVGMKNLRQEIPLSRISPETLQDFLDENCMSTRGYNLSDDEDTDDEDQDEEEEQEETTYDPGFLTNLNNEDVTFKYEFLAPPVTEDQLKLWDPEKQKELEKLALPETDALLYISQSKEHRRLVTHPVIRSYLWIKWKRIRKFYNRNMRVYILFVMCLTWYIFAKFGGQKWEKLHTRSNVSNNDERKFCEETEFPFLSANKDDAGRYGFWWSIFIIQSIIQVILILNDLRQDFSAKSQPIVNFEDFCSACCSVCSASWIDLLLIGLIVMTMWGAVDVLWLVLTVLFVFMAMREVLQLASSIPRYVMNLGNRLDMALLSLVAIILYVPNSSLKNPSTYTLGLYSEEDNQIDNANDCSIKRCLSAVVILLSWIRLLTSIIRHPKTGRANIYLTMFKRVMHSFFRFLIWYALLIIAFGLGFYIMLHKDIRQQGSTKASTPSTSTSDANPCPEKDCCEEDKYEFFDTPWLALVKTSTMFAGEIEFSDIPIDGGNVSATFGYLFLMAFVFLIIMVLMNLLNGLVVSDIAKIQEESAIESNIATITTIAYFESVLLGDPFGNDDHYYGENNSSACRLLRSGSLLQVNSLYINCTMHTFLIFYRL